MKSTLESVDQEKQINFPNVGGYMQSVEGLNRTERLNKGGGFILSVLTDF